LRSFQHALTLSPMHVSVQFDLALVLQELGKGVHALREYKKGLEMAWTKPLSLRRGLLLVALRDLKVALKPPTSQLDKEAAQAALDLLDRALTEVQSCREKAAKVDGRVTRGDWLKAPNSFVYYQLTGRGGLPQSLRHCRARAEGRPGRYAEDLPPLLKGVRRVKWDEEQGLLSWYPQEGGKKPAWEARIVEQAPFSRLAFQSTG